ncbi:amidohydrolase [Miniphocaeibacter massiliensis]|uniref:amidohydrolase n=1 Tax=Miniphocaeibacter massiliensis TaxID=2041841 RepID=UPI000C1B941B|nr:amidohydrolase [Miniphocaeibacter massiliensis]
MGKLAQDYIDVKSEELIELASKIWENPEVGYKEVKASEWTAEFLRKEGFDVTVGDYGVPTSIRASWGEGKPVIGLLGEYDALPGMSQKVKPEKEAIIEGAPGHACQHNLLGVGHVGAAIGLKKEMEEKGLKGTIVFYGCPAEEELTGKVFMARGGAFKDLDIVLDWHPGNANMVLRGKMTAMNTFKLHFTGITAHAGGDPHNGRSALDAVELTHVGINYLREHVTDDVRMHYTIINGGQAPNIVPDKASSWYFVRAFSREAVEDTYERMIKVAKGAAMMTDTEVEVEYLGGCYETLNNKVVTDLLLESMRELGPIKWSEEEKQFAEKLEEKKSNSQGMFSDIGNSALFEGEALDVAMDAFGSTDVGDVLHIAPGSMFMTACTNLGAAGHSWNNTACAGHSIGMKGMLYAAKVMSEAGLKILNDTSIVDKAQEEFKKSMNGKEYKCPIPDYVKVPK